MTPEKFIKTAEDVAILASSARRLADNAKNSMQSRLETGYTYKEEEALKQAREALKNIKRACAQLNEIVLAKIEY